jgi:transposase
MILTQPLIDQANLQGMEADISSQRTRKIQRECDKQLYCLHHLVENGFFYLNHWRGMVADYAKNTDSLLVAVHIHCIALWTQIL